MIPLTASSAAWLAAIAAALALFAATVIAAVRGAENIGLVVLLSVLGLGTGGVTWAAAFIVAFTLPRSRPRPPRYPSAPAPRRCRPAGMAPEEALDEALQALASAGSPAEVRAASREVMTCAAALAVIGQAETAGRLAVVQALQAAALARQDQALAAARDLLGGGTAADKP